jgi:hypothetical protein
MYRVDVTGLQAPFLLKAVSARDASLTLWAPATAADIGGIVNITQLSHIIAGNVIGQSPNTCAPVSPCVVKLVAADIDAAQVLLRARLAPALAQAGVPVTVDLLHTAFAADHSGVDGLLDILEMTYADLGRMVTITNLLTGAQVVDRLDDRLDGTPMPTPLVTPPTLAPGDAQRIAAVRSRFEEIKNQYVLTGGVSIPAIPPICATDFLDKGTTGSIGCDRLSKELVTMGNSLSRAYEGGLFKIHAIGSFDASQVRSLSAGFGDDTSFATVVKNPYTLEEMTWRWTREAGVWKISGDRKLGAFGIRSRHTYDATSQRFVSGLVLEAYAPGVTFSAGDLLRVEGPGLAAAGVLLKSDRARMAVVPDASSPVVVERDPIYGGGAADTLDYSKVLNGSVYTYTYFRANAPTTPAATYRFMLAAAPTAPTALMASQFPVLSSKPTVNTCRQSLSLMLTWTRPTGMNSSRIRIVCETPLSDTGYPFGSKPMYFPDTFVQFTFRGADTNAVWLSLTAVDASEREFALNHFTQQ